MALPNSVLYGKTNKREGERERDARRYRRNSSIVKIRTQKKKKEKKVLLWFTVYIAFNPVFIHHRVALCSNWKVNS